MSSHKVKSVKQGAILMANDLRTGLTVYLQPDGSFASSRENAWVVTDDTEAEQAIAWGASSAEANEIMDPYLADTTENGSPTHIREHLRTTGPSIDYMPAGLSIL